MRLPSSRCDVTPAAWWSWPVRRRADARAAAAARIEHRSGRVKPGWGMGSSSASGWEVRASPGSAPLPATRPWWSRSHWAKRQTAAGSQICSGCPAPVRPGCCRATRDPLAGHGDHSPERGIEHPFAPVDFLAHVQDQRRELGCVARLDPGAECGQAAHERAAPAHCRPRGHLGDTQAPKREQAPVRAGRPGGISPVPAGARARCGARRQAGLGPARECPVGPARHSCGIGVLELAPCPGDGSAGHRQLAVHDGRQALGAVSPSGACTRPGH